MLAPQGLTPLLSKIFLIVKLLMFGNMLIMWTIKMLELIM